LSCLYLSLLKTIITTKTKRKGLKIFELANNIGIAQSLMSRILSGQRRPTTNQLKKLAELLDIDCRELMTDFLSHEVVSLLKPYPQLTEKVMEVAEERISYLTGKEKFNVIPLNDSVINDLKKVVIIKNKYASFV